MSIGYSRGTVAGGVTEDSFLAITIFAITIGGSSGTVAGV